jgi:hypothetical protein
MKSIYPSEHSFLCIGCRTENCDERDEMPDHLDKPQDCKYFELLTQCYWCTKEKECFNKLKNDDWMMKTGDTKWEFPDGDPKNNVFGLCCSVRHKKGYWSC